MFGEVVVDIMRFFELSDRRPIQQAQYSVHHTKCAISCILGDDFFG
jgi:hypothetical protein